MTRREERERLNVNRRILESSEPNECWVRTPEQCPNPAINAHSIQERVLERIADSDDKVITVMARTIGAATNPKRQKFDRIHIGTASAGTYSCKPHDDIFRDVEDKEPNWSDPRATFLLAFRSMLYRDFLARQEQTIWAGKATAFPTDQVAQDGARFMQSRQSQRQNLTDLMLTLYQNDKYDYLAYKTREVRGVPIVAASTTAIVALDESADGEMSFTSVTVYPTDRGHVVSVAFPRKDSDYIESNFHAFTFQEDSDFEEAISEFILINPYNTFLSPDYWKRFSEIQRQTIEQQVLAYEPSKQMAMGLFVPPPKALSLLNLFRVL